VEKVGSKQQHIGAMELFGISGFSFYFGYALISFYWLFVDFPQSYNSFERGMVQLFVFIGLSIALLGISLLKNVLAKPAIFSMTAPLMLVIAMVLPLEVFLANNGIVLPRSAYIAGSLCTGLAGGYFTLRWLDGAGSARIQRHLTFTSAGIAGGAVLFFLVKLVMPLIQPLFAVVYIIVSFALMVFLRSRTNTQDDFTIKSRREFLSFTREVEPAIFAYGIVFGIGFALLFIEGAYAVLWGMLAVFLGALIVLVCDIAGMTINITITQRVILIVVVAACLIVPFTNGWLHVLGLCLTIASWAAFNAVNWAILVKRSVSQKSRVFFSVSSGASVSTLGYLIGWALMLIFAYLGFPQVFVSPVMLGMAFLLVAVVMLFFPQQQHHDEASAQSQQATPAIHVAAGGATEQALFQLRCEKVTALYGLSVREGEVLAYLAKGRNANYIQKMLVVSPHTAKSHIYNIYRKLNIHSQQKLMDFIEEYPVEIKQ
jgi:DNA-binding CsgD family transcriptional regulator